MARGRKGMGTADGTARPYAQLEAALQHEFMRSELLTLALTHRSYTYEERHGAPAEPIPVMHPDQRSQRNPPGSDNEQLEFLGDAVIGLAVTEALYREFPHCSEGELTRLRSNLVSRKRLAEMGNELGLAEALRLGRSAEHNGGRQKLALVANATEAVLAAVYLDANAAAVPECTAGLATVRRLAEQYLLRPELPAMRTALAEDLGRGAMRDHKTLLQERVQAAGIGKLRYVDISQTGPAHQRQFQVEAHLIQNPGTGDEQARVLAAAEGGSKKEAQQRAAELALATLRKDGGEPGIGGKA